MSDKYNGEMVLCVKSSDIQELLVGPGGLLILTNERKVVLDEIITGRRTVRFVPRINAESDPSWKQIIPVCVFVHNTNQQVPMTLESGMIFHYTRGKKQGEQRLHDLKSICVGGHINPQDCGLPCAPSTTSEHLPPPSFDVKAAYTAAMMREVSEEVEITCQHVGGPVAFLYDNTTPVGEVHLGIVYGFTCESMAVVAKEDSMVNPGWLSLQKALEQKEEFESWGKLILDHLAANVALAS